MDCLSFLISHKGSSGSNRKLVNNHLDTKCYHSPKKLWAWFDDLTASYLNYLICLVLLCYSCNLSCCACPPSLKPGTPNFRNWRTTHLTPLSVPSTLVQPNKVSGNCWNPVAALSSVLSPCCPTPFSLMEINARWPRNKFNTYTHREYDGVNGRECEYKTMVWVCVRWGVPRFKKKKHWIKKQYNAAQSSNQKLTGITPLWAFVKVSEAVRRSQHPACLPKRF